MKFLEGLYREHRLLYSVISVLVMVGGGALFALLTDLLLRGRGCSSR